MENTVHCLFPVRPLLSLSVLGAVSVGSAASLISTLVRSRSDESCSMLNIPVETLQMGGQRGKQGQEFKKCEAKCGAVRLELDNVGAGASAAVGRWGPGRRVGLALWWCLGRGHGEFQPRFLHRWDPLVPDTPTCSLPWK